MPLPESSSVTDQTILEVGAGKQFSTINAAILAANQMSGNADIKVDAGTYTNDGGYLYDGINNVTIEGVGGTVQIVDPTFYAGGKAAIVTGGQNILLKNLDISGITVPDGNGAGVRYDQGTLTLDNVHLHNNQNGILGAPDANGSITISDSEIDHNGTNAGNTHNIYIGDIAQFTLTNSYIHDANVGHEVKSRAENNTIVGNRIFDNNATSSYSIDLPNGGNATITNNVIEQGANGQNHIINDYGEEGNLHAGTAVTFSNNQVVNDYSNGAGPLWNNNAAIITGNANTVWNLTDLGNSVSGAGITQLSSRPNLDTSSPSVPPANPSEDTSSSFSRTNTLPPGSPQKTYRFFDTVNGTQFLTSSDAERDTLMQNPSKFTYEGHGMGSVTMDPSNSNVASVFRFFNMSNGTHFFTTDAGERNTILATRSDLVQERANFAEHLQSQAGDTAVFRFFDSHSGDHFFTQNAAERANIVATRPDMVSEGVAFYAPNQT